MVILTVDMCPLWQMNSGVQASKPDSCHSTTEDSSKLQQMVRFIWPSTAILKDQLANCCDGGMKIGDLFRARGGKHKCFWDTEFKQIWKNCIHLLAKPDPWESLVVKPHPSNKSGHGKYKVFGQLHCNLFRAPFPQCAHVFTGIPTHAYTAYVFLHTVANQSVI